MKRVVLYWLLCEYYIYIFRCIYKCWGVVKPNPKTYVVVCPNQFFFHIFRQSWTKLMEHPWFSHISPLPPLQCWCKYIEWWQNVKKHVSHKKGNFSTLLGGREGEIGCFIKFWPWLSEFEKKNISTISCFFHFNILCICYYASVLSVQLLLDRFSHKSHYPPPLPPPLHLKIRETGIIFTDDEIFL